MNQRLQAILAQKQREVAELSPVNSAPVHPKPNANEPGRFERALRQPGVSIITEIKRRSPSAGSLSTTLDAALLAQRYEVSGATAISCLTDQTFFGAEADDFDHVRCAVTIPVMRKDFILDERQIDQSVAMQADAILLIVRILTPTRLAALHQYACACGLDVLVETHDAAEIDAAVDAGARIIGINNRDLDDFSADFERCLRLRDRIPRACIAVAESAINTANDISQLRNVGFDAALVGTALVTAADVDRRLQEFIAAGQSNFRSQVDEVNARAGVAS